MFTTSFIQPSLFVLLTVVAASQVFADPAVDQSVLTSELRTSFPFDVVREGEEDTAELVLSNPNAKPLFGEVEVRLTDFFGATRSLKVELSLEAKGTQSIALPVDELSRGVWYVDATATWGEGQAFHARHGLAKIVAVGPHAEPPAPFYFASSVGYRPDKKDPEAHAKMIHAAALAGIEVVRTNFDWRRIERGPGRWDFEHYDHIVAECRKRGMKVQPFLGFSPRWAMLDSALATDPENHANPPKLDAWRDYVTKLAERYHEDAALWVTWNEPDFIFHFNGDVDQFIELQKVAYKAIKAVDPDAVVATGGFATVHPHHYREHYHFQRDFLIKAEGYYDVHAHHEHGLFGRFVTAIDGDLADYRSQVADPGPLYFEETAISDVRGQDFQAETGVKKVIFARARGALGYVWFVTQSSGKVAKWGLFEKDFTPKAIYPAYSTLARFLDDRVLHTELELGVGNHGYSFYGDGEYFLAAWSEDDDAQAGLWAVRVSLDAEVSYVDMMGNERELAVHHGTVPLRVGRLPAYLVVRSSSAAPQVVGPMASIRPLDVWTPGRQVEVFAELANPTSVDLPLALGEAEAIVLDPGQTETPIAQRLIPPDGDYRLGDRTRVRLAYAGPDPSWSGVIELPVVAGALIPVGPVPGGRRADFVLDHSSKLVNVSQFALDGAETTWRGRPDVSAEVWLAADDSTLVIHAAVRDDQHRPADAGMSPSQGDSVQIVLAMPGAVDAHGFTFFQDAAGEPRVMTDSRSDGAVLDAEPVRLAVETAHGALTYRAEVPLSAVGMQRDDLRRGVRFNLQVNDNDLGTRESWMQIVPGIAEPRPIDSFPLVTFP